MSATAKTLDSLPAPLTPPECDLGGMEWMPFHGDRLFSSEMWLLASAEGKVAIISLLWAAWRQVPAASLPDNEILLAHLSSAGSRWRNVRECALYGWVRCSDGRLYHPVLAEKALNAWESRLAQRERTRAARAAREARRHSDGLREPATPAPASSVTDDVTEHVAGSRGEGQKRRGEESEEVAPSTLSPNGESSEGVSAGQPAEPQAAVKVKGQKLPRLASAYPMDLLYEMAAAWNEMARDHGLPQVSEVNEKRAQHLRARIEERWKRDPMGMWRRYLKAIAASPFLRGENERRWKANFDWAVRKDTPVRVHEGRYSDDEDCG